jgi:hypothetical protein
MVRASSSMDATAVVSTDLSSRSDYRYGYRPFRDQCLATSALLTNMTTDISPPTHPGTAMDC